LADWVGRRVAWLRATLAESRPNEQGSERGQGLTEYALIISLIALVVLGALTFFGLSLEAVFLDPIASEVTRVFEGM
jgi:Flp pilus assembly pilin Flp